MDMDMDIDPSMMRCSMCPSNEGLEDGNDGFFYCKTCGSQAEEFQETGVADEDFIDKGGEAGAGAGGGGIYAASLRRSKAVIKAEPISQVNQFWTQEGNGEAGEIGDGYGSDADCFGPATVRDFGDVNDWSGLDYEGYYSMVRLTYVMGLQMMVQFQCEALVRDFGVNPVVCGLAGSVWLRFVSNSGVFDDDWADQAVFDSETNKEGESSCIKTRPEYRREPHNLYGRRAVMIWLSSLKKTIPIHSTLAISFLVCHIAREAILPADIVKWAREGKLPYFVAYVQIENILQREKQNNKSRSCPISISTMFRPKQSVPAHVLEVLAARVADSINLHLPPVNFYAIARRYLKKLSVPMEEVLPHACRIYEWLMPPELWLSKNEYRLPTSLYVMAIIIVTIRTLYNIHGFGYWEKSLSNNLGMSSTPNLDPSCNSNFEGSAEVSSDSGILSHSKKSKLDAERLLHMLESRYHELVDIEEYSVDSPTYIQYCNDLAFAGVEIPREDSEDVQLVNQLLDFYKHEKDCNSAMKAEGPMDGYSGKKRSRIDCLDDDEYTKCFHNKKSMDEKCHSGSSIDDKTSSDSFSRQEYNRDSYYSEGDGISGPVNQASADSLRDAAIRKIKLNMEENRFTYIPPRVNMKRFDYLHYARKKDDGAMTYIAHADYYILLRACAKVAQVDARIMHIMVLSCERRLAFMERRVDYCLNLRSLNITCENCLELKFKDAVENQ